MYLIHRMLGKSYFAIEFNSPRHITTFRKWLFCANRNIYIGAVSWNIRILGLSVFLMDRWGSLIPERLVSKINKEYREELWEEFAKHL